MKKKIISLIIVALMLVSMTISAAPVCGIFYIASVEPPHCMTSPCEGESTTYYQILIKERECIADDNSIYHEEIYVFRKLACGC